MTDDERIRIECRQCGWAASSTDLQALSDAADAHEARWSGHRVVDA